MVRSLLDFFILFYFSKYNLFRLQNTPTKFRKDPPSHHMADQVTDYVI